MIYKPGEHGRRRGKKERKEKEKESHVCGAFRWNVSLFPEQKAHFSRDKPGGNLIPAFSRLDQGLAGPRKSGLFGTVCGSDLKWQPLRASAGGSIPRVQCLTADWPLPDDGFIHAAIKKFPPRVFAQSREFIFVFSLTNPLRFLRSKKKSSSSKRQKTSSFSSQWWIISSSLFATIDPGNDGYINRSDPKRIETNPRISWRILV